jgi:hypothetical protein
VSWWERKASPLLNQSLLPRHGFHCLVHAEVGVDRGFALFAEPVARMLGRMKTLTISQARTRLGTLVDGVQKGGPVILIHGNKLAKLERYELLDPEADSPQLEAALLEAVQGPHAPYSRAEMDSVLAKVCKEERKR